MSELWQFGLAELSALVERGEASCAEVVSASLDRIGTVDEQIGAFLSVRAEAALREASEADRARAKGTERGPLHGLPFAVKDNLVSPDFETTCASKILRGMRAPYEATVLARIREAGMVALGTTNMDEFAMGSSCENSSVRPTRNPWDLTRVPGGSSGGSAAAVAAREIPVALGSDTGGSIRQPSALCGVVGLKPTYGRVSRYGLVAFASSLDQVGTLTRSARDAALMLGLIAGRDPLDSTSLDAPVSDYGAALTGSVAGLRIGLPKEFFVEDGLDPGTRAALDASLATLKELGAIPVELSLPLTEYATAAYYLICTAEASSNLSRYDGVKYGIREPGDSLEEMYLNSRSRGFGAEVKRRILLGTFVLSAGYYDAYYRKAQQVRTLVRRDFESAFERCDLIATPTTPGPAWPLGERLEDPLAMYLSDIFTVSVNLAGLPALSVPCGRSGGLPVGLQLIGPPLCEQTLLRAADSYLEHTGFHRDVPELPGAQA